VVEPERRLGSERAVDEAPRRDRATGALDVGVRVERRGPVDEADLDAGRAADVDDR